MEAGVLVRNQEGPWAWYRLPEEGVGGELARLIVDLLPSDDRQHAQDLKRLQAISEGWTTRVADFFRQHAGDWEQIRSLHADQAAVDAALLAALPTAPIDEPARYRHGRRPCAAADGQAGAIGHRRRSVARDAECGAVQLVSRRAFATARCGRRT